jgi:hypothetical protein
VSEYNKLDARRLGVWMGEARCVAGRKRQARLRGAFPAAPPTSYMPHLLCPQGPIRQFCARLLNRLAIPIQLTADGTVPNGVTMRN